MKVKKSKKVDDSLKEILGKNVRYYRYLNKLTQEKLAERSELSPRYVSDIENGNGNIPIDTLLRLSKVLNVKPYQLIKKRDYNAKPPKLTIR